MLSFVISALLIGSSAQAQSNACEKSVVKQATAKLASQVAVKSVTVKSVEVRDDSRLFTLKVTSSNSAGKTVVETAEAKANGDCEIMGAVEILPDSAKSN